MFGQSLLNEHFFSCQTNFFHFDLLRQFSVAFSSKNGQARYKCFERKDPSTPSSLDDCAREKTTTSGLSSGFRQRKSEKNCFFFFLYICNVVLVEKQNQVCFYDFVSSVKAKVEFHQYYHARTPRDIQKEVGFQFESSSFEKKMFLIQK